MNSLKSLNKYLWKYRYHLLLGTIFVVISNFFAIVPAQVVRHAFDLIKETIVLYLNLNGFDNRPGLYDLFASNVMFYGAIIVCMALLRGIFLFLVRQTIIVMSRKIEFDQKNEIFKHYQELPIAFYRRNRTGDLITRISEDVSKVRMYTGPALMYGINLVVLITMLLVYMFSVNVKLTFYILLPLPFLSASIFYVNNLINKYSEEIQTKLSRLSTFVQESFSGIRVIKAFAREESMGKKFEEENASFRHKALKLARVESLFFPLIMGLVGASTIITILAGGAEVMKGNITTGNIAEFVIYVNMLTWPVASLGWVLSIVQRAEASQKRINEFLNQKGAILSHRKLIPKQIKGNIEFKNVSFEYEHSGIKALKNISFNLDAGKTIALLGNTGSGKSTVANLLCRLYDPTQGEIILDGQNLIDFEPQNLRRHVGYVPQDVFLFSDTIANNISFGLLQQPTKATIIEAAKDADIYQNIEDFPAGLETMLGERGINLSGGQKQRLSIARALILKPKILILDDVLSAVDTETENAILNNLKKIMKGRTSLIISHRVSSARLADEILVLHDGEIVQKGNHQTLIKQPGLYKQIYEKQLKAETDTEKA